MVWNHKLYTITTTTLRVYIFQQSNELWDSKQVYWQSQQLKAERNEAMKIMIKKMIWLLQLNCNERRRILNCLYHAYVIVIICLLPTMFNWMMLLFSLSIKMVFCQLTQRSIFAVTGLQIPVTKTLNYRHKIASFFLEPILIHFEKDAFIFNQFAAKMWSFRSKIKNLKTIGTDQELLLYNGFASQIPNLHKRLLTIYT